MEGDAGRWARQGAAPAAPRLQHVFVGATVPNAGTRNVSLMLQKRWPAATWVETPELHKTLTRIEHRFIEVDRETRPLALREALAGGVAAGPALVFANSIEGVAEACAILKKSGHRAEIFTKELPLEERRERLARFKAGELPLLVCSGLAARGLDLPQVAHVVQYEFAGNAVDHLHRIGRTARAGAAGRATTLYTQKELELVRTIEGAGVEGTTVEGAFSRKRSFRNKLRKQRKAARGSQI